MENIDEFIELKSQKLNVTDFIEKNSINEDELVKNAMKQIFDLEKQKREIDVEIRDIKTKLSKDGINITEFNRVLSTLKNELKMSIDSLSANISMYNSIVSDKELLQNLKDQIND
ncbi:hypothetical protein [Campylobacter phage CP81]|uniref:Uncharacterized protein n=6 Tax=Fletchervirus TaxID=1636618 RepID=G8GIV4_9CAUD|nr:hypothetical protein NCTC12673_gp098 [Campylobacter phage NCTC12673]YP_004956908.1 hypothetical protein CaPhCPX_gp042 [Campylobacter phage CPX]YP_009321755.1 hypothetical protein BOX06_gp168 [Campylobacter phage PC14]YP_009623355.1 hypothetical protein FDJ37_gp129 [Campylobacter phage CP81]AGS81213.1 hypothetical protein [Campylobacter phage CP8]AVR55793.1 hypothetical protein [Campylobacter phage CP39]WGA02381.1 hypothetical protein [Campylobacter phage vB_Cj_QDYZ]AEA86442.1 hypothetical